MKRLFLGIVVATLAYAAWWFYAAHTLQSDIEAWFEDQRAAGWQASFSDIAVRGFPNRTDVTLTNPVLRAPDGRFGWEAPFFQILGLTYKTGHVIVAWPDTQSVNLPTGKINIQSDGLRASVIHDDDLILRSNVEAAVLNLTNAKQSFALAGVNVALEKIAPSPAEYRIALSIEGFAVSEPDIAGVIAPATLASLRANTAVNLSAPLAFDTVTKAPPHVDRLTLRNTRANYGALTLGMTGEATFDTAGLASGEVHLKAENWRDTLDAAQQAGDLPPELSETLGSLLTLLTTLNGGGDTLDMTLGLDRGTVLLGPLPIGQVPPLNWQ